MEEWVPVPEFPHYEVSNHGRIRNSRMEVRRLSKNQSGVVIITFSVEGKHHVRSVHKLVAQSFLGEMRPGYRPVHIDGNRENNHVDNLRWIPAYDLAAYRRQERRTEPIVERGIIFTATGDRFANCLEASRLVGLPEELILEHAEHDARYGHSEMTHYGNPDLGIPPARTGVRFTE